MDTNENIDLNYNDHMNWSPICRMCQTIMKQSYNLPQLLETAHQLDSRNVDNLEASFYSRKNLVELGNRKGKHLIIPSRWSRMPGYILTNIYCMNHKTEMKMMSKGE